MKLSEKQIENQILTWLNYQPDIFAFKINMTGIYDTEKKIFRRNNNRFIHKGTADIVGICKGLFFAIEVKTPQALKRLRSSPTQHDRNQDSFLRKVLARGGYAAKIASLEGAVEFISRFPHRETYDNKSMSHNLEMLE